MELKKCERCGCFFISENLVCCNCEVKDKQDIYKLSNFIETNKFNSVDELSRNTGISSNNINRYICNKSISILNNLK